MANNNEKATFDVSQKSEAFFDRNKKVISGVIIAVIVVVAGWLCYRQFVSVPREDKASTELAKGQDFFNAEQFDKALNGDGAGYAGFVKIAADYGSTDAGNLANLYAGLCYAHMQKPDWKNALKYVKEFDTSNDMIISPASQMALGDIYANNNQLDDAVKSFKKAADMADSEAADKTNNSVAPLALRKAGVILEKQGKKDEAHELYTNIKKKYINSAVYQDIDKYIERTAK